MADIQKHGRQRGSRAVIRERGGKFEVAVYVGRTAAGKRRQLSGTAPTRRKAEALERKLRNDVDGGRVTDGTAATFGQLIDRWLLHARVEESTRYAARLQLEKHVRPVLGSVKLAKLKPEDLDDLYLSLERGRGKGKLAPATVRRLHATLRSVLALGVRLRWIARNPAESASPPPSGAREPTAPATETILAFLASLDEEPGLAMFVRLDAVTGMRRAEVCALRRSDLDLAGGSLRKMRTLGTAKGAPYVKAVKAGPRHPIALDAETVYLLELHLKRQDALAELAARTVADDAYVFSLEVDGSRPMRPDFVSKQIRTHRENVPGAEKLTLRALRHWMATTGFGLGASPKDVQGRGGWARASTPLDHYSAHLPPSGVALALALGAALDGDADGEADATGDDSPDD